MIESKQLGLNMSTMESENPQIFEEENDFDRWLPNNIRAKKLEDEYLLGDVIGREPSSVVYKCLRKGRTEWSCRVLKKKFLDKKAFQREIQTLLKLKHPNIMQIKDVFETSDEIQLISEMANGDELFERIVRKGRYTEKDAAHAVCHVLNALHYLHSKGIIHKGVKPENIFYKTSAEDSILQLSDFGISRMMADENYMINGVFGNFRLLAPEILQNHDYDSSLDLWSLGVVTYVMLCGFEPFWDEESHTVTNKKIIEGDLSFPSPSWDKVSEGAKDLIKRLLSNDPKRRLTAGEALNHPWVLGRGTSTIPIPDETLSKLREFNAKRKFRVATTAVIATNRALAYLPLIKTREREDKTVISCLNQSPSDGKPNKINFQNDLDVTEDYKVSNKKTVITIS